MCVTSGEYYTLRNPRLALQLTDEQVQASVQPLRNRRMYASMAAKCAQSLVTTVQQREGNGIISE